MRISYFRRYKKATAALILLLFMGLTPAFGQNFEVKIESKADILQGNDNDINLLLGNRPYEISSFTFRVSYDREAFHINDILPGEILVGQGLEYFRFQPAPPEHSGYKKGVVKISALLENPLPAVSGTIDTLAILNLQVSNDRELACDTIPFRFYWAGCGSNKMYTAGKDTVFITNDVYDYNGNLITKDTLIPTEKGDPSVCDRGWPEDKNRSILRAIDFYNGYAEIICPDSIECPFPGCPGDLDWDNNPYERGDLAVFVNYFLFCNYDAFNFDVDGQIAASDVNEDGYVLTIEDFAYLSRFVTGDTIVPPPIDTTYQGFLFIEDGHKWMTISSYIMGMSLGAVYASFYIPNSDIDSVFLLANIEGIELQYNTCHDTLNVLLFSLKAGVSIPYWAADIFGVKYSGERPQEISADAAGYYGEIIDVSFHSITSDRGDLNLNGIAYETADAILFNQYFLNCNYDAFTIDVGRQRWASDVNLDRDDLTVEDYIYLQRIIMGNAAVPPPIDTIFDATIFSTADSGVIVLSYQCDINTGGIYIPYFLPSTDIDTIILNYDVAPMRLDYDFCQDSLKIFINSLSGMTSISGGRNGLLTLYYSGDEPAMAIPDAAGYNGEKIDVTIDTIAIPEPGPFAFGIDVIEDVQPGHNVTVNINKTKGNSTLEAFDFLIAYNATILTAIQAVPGELIADKFEYFTYRHGPFGGCGDSCPSGMLRLVGLRETNNGVVNNYYITGLGPLVELQFYLTNDPYFECIFTPIKFYWIDCGDNTVAYKDSINAPNNQIKLGLAADVYDIDYDYNVTYVIETVLVTDPLAEFPSYHGIPDSCLDPGADSLTFRYVDFYNGGIIIDCDTGCMCRGDVNVNGVSFEIADWVVYRNYFLYGLEAFTINVEAQTCCCEVNGDGEYPTIEDFVLMMRIITGDAIPIDPDSIYNAQLRIDADAHEITATSVCDTALGAYYLEFNTANVSIDSIIFDYYALADFELLHNERGDTLHILISSFEAGARIPAGETVLVRLFYSGGYPEILTAGAAGYYGEKINLETTGITELEFFRIAIEPSFDIYSGQICSVRVVKEYGADPVSVMRFVIGFDYPGDPELSFSDIKPGILYDDGYPEPWEAFSHGKLSLPGTAPGQPTKAVEVAMAPETITDYYNEARAEVIPDGTVLFTLVLKVEDFGDPPSDYWPIEFYWVGCMSNAVKVDYALSPSGRMYGLADDVYRKIGSAWINVADATTGFPTATGGQDICDQHPDGSIYMRINDFYDGWVDISGADTVGGYSSSDATNDDNTLPDDFRLYQNRPNPFNPNTQILFDLPQRTDWRLDIFDIIGRKVRSFESTDPAGTVMVSWDGRGESGSLLSTGIYLYRLRAGNFVDTKKMVLMK